MFFDTTYYFIFFLVILVAVRVTPSPGWILLAASVLFYAAAGWADLALISTMIVTNFSIPLVIRSGKGRISVAVLTNLAVLFLFKYRSLLFGVEGLSALSFADVALPLGISFYTFQMIAYQVDVARNTCQRVTKLPEFALFVAFFPQLIAGPICRANQLLPQLARRLRGGRPYGRLASYGLGLFLLGVIKKVFFADSLAPHVDAFFISAEVDPFSAWLGAWLFTFQIYFDFSGYSDIAVGCAYLLGIRLPFNFRTPYLSCSPREFWRRWHITLSSWIRDYLYIPLGGRNGSLPRQLAVLIAVMAVAGLWHGANWTFVLWGTLWGVYIVLWRLLGDVTGTISRWMWFPHMLVIVNLWVFFRSPDIGFAFDYLSAMYGGGSADIAISETLQHWGLWIIAGAAGLMLLHYAEDLLLQHRTLLVLRRYDGPLMWGLMVGVIFFLVTIPEYDINPFIYFRF